MRKDFCACLLLRVFWTCEVICLDVHDLGPILRTAVTEVDYTSLTTDDFGLRNQRPILQAMTAQTVPVQDRIDVLIECSLRTGGCAYERSKVRYRLYLNMMLGFSTRSVSGWGTTHNVRCHDDRRI